MQGQLSSTRGSDVTCFETCLQFLSSNADTLVMIFIVFIRFLQESLANAKGNA